MAARTKENAYAVLNAALRKAVEMRTLERNPCEPIRRPRYEPEPIHPFTLDEVRLIQRETEGTRYHAWP